MKSKLPLEIWSKIIHILTFELRDWSGDPLHRPSSILLSTPFTHSSLPVQPAARSVSLVCKKWHRLVISDRKFRFIQVLVGIHFPGNFDDLERIFKDSHPFTLQVAVKFPYVYDKEPTIDISRVFEALCEHSDRLQALSVTCTSPRHLELTSNFLTTRNLPHLQYFRVSYDWDDPIPITISKLSPTLNVLRLAYLPFHLPLTSDELCNLTNVHIVCFYDREDSTPDRNIFTLLQSARRLEHLRIGGDTTNFLSEINNCTHPIPSAPHLYSCNITGNPKSVMKFVSQVPMPKLKTLIIHCPPPPYWLSSNEGMDDHSGEYPSFPNDLPEFPYLHTLECFNHAYTAIYILSSIPLPRLENLKLVSRNRWLSNDALGTWPPMQSLRSLATVSVDLYPMAAQWLLHEFSEDPTTRPTSLIFYLYHGDVTLHALPTHFLNHINHLTLSFIPSPTPTNLRELYVILSSLESLTLLLHDLDFNFLRDYIPPLYYHQLEDFEPETLALDEEVSKIILPRLTTFSFFLRSPPMSSSPVRYPTIPPYASEEFLEYITNRASLGLPIKKLICDCPFEPEAVAHLEDLIEVIVQGDGKQHPLYESQFDFEMF